MYIGEEGLSERNRAGVTGWMCVHCWHHVTYTQAGICPNCKVAGTLKEVKSFARLKEETEAMVDRQRFKTVSEGFDPYSPESQMGQALSTGQLVEILQKFIPGVVAIPTINAHIQRLLTALYIPRRRKKEILMPTEQIDTLDFICACETGIMPEWDIIQADAKGLPLAPIRGWRSVLGIFYRQKLIPFIPDDGRRLSWHQIKQSPKRRFDV